jgi:hypothetical protein
MVGGCVPDGRVRALLLAVGWLAARLRVRVRLRGCPMTSPVRWRNGRLQWQTRRTWQPSRILRLACRCGLHFLAEDFRRDGYFCECGRQRLHGEDIRT